MIRFLIRDSFRYGFDPWLIVSGSFGGAGGEVADAGDGEEAVEAETGGQGLLGAEVVVAQTGHGAGSADDGGVEDVVVRIGLRGHAGSGELGGRAGGGESSGFSGGGESSGLSGGGGVEDGGEFGGDVGGEVAVAEVDDLHEGEAGEVGHAEDVAYLCQVRGVGEVGGEEAVKLGHGELAGVARLDAGAVHLHVAERIGLYHKPFAHGVVIDCMEYAVVETDGGGHHVLVGQALVEPVDDVAVEVGKHHVVKSFGGQKALETPQHRRVFAAPRFGAGLGAQTLGQLPAVGHESGARVEGGVGGVYLPQGRLKDEDALRQFLFQPSVRVDEPLGVGETAALERLPVIARHILDGERHRHAESSVGGGGGHRTCRERCKLVVDSHLCCLYRNVSAQRAHWVSSGSTISAGTLTVHFRAVSAVRRNANVRSSPRP